MITLQRVPVSRLLTHRDSFTRACGFAGIPVSQMWLLLPLVQRILNGIDEPRPTDTFYRAAVEQAKTGGGGGHTYEELRELALDIKQNGIREPVTGWRVGSRVELLGGHHRACIAHVLGIPTLAIKMYSLDLATEFGCSQEGVKAAYGAVRAAEKGLPAGMTYLPVLGCRSIRSGWDRLSLLYDELISLKGYTVLDAGCNDGFFGANLLLHNFSVRFLDYSAALINVAKARCEALRSVPTLAAWKGKAYFDVQSIQGFLQTNTSRYDAIIFMDVLQHIAYHSGATVALDTLSGLLKCMNERMILAPGRKDMLDDAGVTERALFERLKGYRLRYLGKDSDGSNYGREIYVVYR